MNKKLKMVATAAVAVGATGSVALSLAQGAFPFIPEGTPERTEGASIYASAFSRARTDVSVLLDSFSSCRVYGGAFESKFVSVAFSVSSFSSFSCY